MFSIQLGDLWVKKKLGQLFVRSCYDELAIKSTNINKEHSVALYRSYVGGYSIFDNFFKYAVSNKVMLPLWTFDIKNFHIHAMHVDVDIIMSWS